MRHVVLQFWLSLDGFSCDEDTELYRLMEEIEDPEQEEYFVGRLRQAGTHIMGRVTYEEMAEFWPSSDHPIAAPLNEIPKIVFSRQPPVSDLAPGPDRPRGHGGGTGAAEAGIWRGDHRPRRNSVRAVPDPARPGGRVPALGAARRGGAGRAAVHRAGPAGDPEPGQDHGVSVRHPRAVLRADRPRGVTFKIPNGAAPPAHETGLERGAVPGLAPAG